MQIARLADPDALRNRVRGAFLGGGGYETLKQTATNLDLERQPIQTVLLLARALLDENDSTAATQILNAVQFRHPNKYSLNHIQLTCHLKANRLSEAVGYQRANLALRPASSREYTMFGLLLVRQSDLVNAEAASRKAIRLNPQDPSAYYALGRVLTMRKKYPEAEVAFRDGLRVKPDSTFGHSSLGALLYSLKRYKEAEAVFREAIHLNQDNGHAHFALGQILLTEAKAAGSAAHWDEAAEESAKAIDYLADKADTWRLDSPRISLCFELAQSDEMFRRIAKLQPREPNLWIGRGQYLALCGKWAEAEAEYAKGIHACPPSGRSIEYAYLLMLLGKLDQHRVYCRELLDRYPPDKSDELNLYLIARTCAAGQGSIDANRLIEWMTKSLERQVSYGSQVFTLGLAQFRAGLYDEAIQSLQKSNQIAWGRTDENFVKSQSLLVMAMAHHRRGNTSEAARCMQTARLQIARVALKLAQVKQYDYNTIKIYPMDWICTNALLKEAEALLFPKAIDANANTRRAEPKDQSPVANL